MRAGLRTCTPQWEIGGHSFISLLLGLPNVAKSLSSTVDTAKIDRDDVANYDIWKALKKGISEIVLLGYLC